MKHFTGRVAFVTGGASGIGFGLAQNFLKEGMKVAVVDYNPAHLAEARKMYAGNRSVQVIQADVSDREQVRAAAAEAVQMFGKIHVLCNNAGIGGGGNAEDPDFDAWDRAMQVNLGGVVNGVKIIAPLIIGHGEGGHIVNTASMAGIVPNPLPGLGAYMTAKFAVRGFTESLRISIAHYGIGVSCLCPGGTRTRIMDDAKKRDAPARKTIDDLLASSMDPLELGAMVVEGIRNNAPYILTHAEFRDEVRQIHAMLDAAFPRKQLVPAGRAAFEEHRRSIIARAHAQPVKD
jgi:NAD(P)-dependent dehydrogenase (short-subunit alcohol dehydrogenase family)